ncbi:MAG: hypothetical protein H6644_11620 [Caldilineaceae bacterium]|nr:hypothetical protein [Caldilineaceae bacterium]
MGAAIGKIVKSNSHIDYVCQVYAPGEMTPAPAPDAYAFGSFVAIESEAATGALHRRGLQHATGQPGLRQPGPALSEQLRRSEVFLARLPHGDSHVGRAADGGLDGRGGRRASGRACAGHQCQRARARRLRKDELVAFHRRDGLLCLHYFLPVLMAQDNPLVPPLLLAIIERLGELFPEERSRLTVMRNNLAWRRTVTPMG